MGYLLYVDDRLHHSNGTNILRLEVLKDILDVDFVLRLHSLLSFKGHTHRVMIEYSLRCSKIIE